MCDPFNIISAFLRGGISVDLTPNAEKVQVDYNIVLNNKRAPSVQISENVKVQKKKRVKVPRGKKKISSN